MRSYLGWTRWSWNQEFGGRLSVDSSMTSHSLGYDCRFCSISSGASGGVLHRGPSLRSKRLISLHEKRCPESRKNEVKLRPPLSA